MLQETKRRNLVQVAMLKSAVKQFVHPSWSVIQEAGGWTMRAPPKSDSKAPSSLQVLLLGRFYVYQASESRLKKVNEAQNMNFKARWS